MSTPDESASPGGASSPHMPQFSVGPRDSVTVPRSMHAQLLALMAEWSLPLAPLQRVRLSATKSYVQKIATVVFDTRDAAQRFADEIAKRTQVPWLVTTVQY